MNIPQASLICALTEGEYFSDCHAIKIRYDHQSALELYLIIAKATPNWVNGMMAFRNQIVSKLGLKDLGTLSEFDATKPTESYQIGDRVGIFSIFSNTQKEVILEDNDKHLNVKVSFFIEPDGDYATLYVSTVVHVNNVFGKVYMLFVEPMHKLIVPASLKSLAVA